MKSVEILAPTFTKTVLSIVRKLGENMMGLGQNILNIIKNEVNNFYDQAPLRILVLGATGVGKSSLINAIFNAPLQKVNTIKSTTRSFSTHLFQVNQNLKVQITDSPGYGEVGYDQQYKDDLIIESKHAHAIILVLKADEKGYQRDLDIVSSIIGKGDFSDKKPLIIALNQIDKIKPSREWDPPYDNIDSPISPDDSLKLKNMKAKLSLVKSQFGDIVGSQSLKIVPTMADPEEGSTWGILELQLKIKGVLPEAQRYHFFILSQLAENRVQEILEELDRETEVVIKAASASAATAVALNPIPASDFFALAPIQVGMVIKIGAIYGRNIDNTNAKEIFTTLGAGFAARTVFQGIISLFPGIKNVLGSPYAAAATYAFGQLAKSYFRDGAIPSSKELETVLNQQMKIYDKDDGK